MSLSSFLNQKDVRAKFRQEFTKPKFTEIRQLLAPILTSNYSMVGTAFDYLMRFYLQAHNPQAIARSWVPELPLYKWSKIDLDRVMEVKQNYEQFLQTKQLTDELIESTLFLAQLDAVYRGRNVEFKQQPVELQDVEDLKQLISLVDWELFKSRDVMLLNPTFGSASEKIGGADADLVIDETLIEIKTVKDCRLERDYLNQLVGYYILSKLGGIDGAPDGHIIKRLGVYFSRHAYLYIFNVDDVIDEQRFSQFMQWFRWRVEKRG